MARRKKSVVATSYGMSGKLSGIAAFNTNPLSNTFCVRSAKNLNWVCSKCYASKNAKGYRANCVPCWERNSKVLSESTIEWDLLPILKKGTRIVRFNAYGELINKNHFINYMNIAKKNPTAKFSLYTKRPNFVDLSLVPSNVTLVYSSYLLNDPSPKLPAGFHHTFSVYTLDWFKQANKISNCPLDCFKCLKCYGKKGEVHIQEVVKSDQSKYAKYLLTLSAADNTK